MDAVCSLVIRALRGLLLQREVRFGGCWLSPLKLLEPSRSNMDDVKHCTARQLI